ncbi:hypothetical protein D3C76_821080 [compost metagenome]
MLFAVEGESGLHHVAHRFALQFETQAHAAVGKQHVGQVAELVDRLDELRVEAQALAVLCVGHPAAAFLAQQATEFTLQKLLEAPGVGADDLPEHRQRGVAGSGRKGVAAGERCVPFADDRPLPLAVEAAGRGLQDALPGLLQRLHEQGLADAAPLRAEAGGELAAVGAGVGEVDAFALEHGLRQGLGHVLRVGGMVDLLQGQASARDLVEEGLQTQAFAVVLAFGGFAEQGQQRTKGGIQGAFRSLQLLLDQRPWGLGDQLLRRTDQRVGQRLGPSAGLPLISQSVHQGDQRRLAHVAHQGQLVDHLAQAVGRLPAQAVEELQPGAGVVLEVAPGQAFAQHVRGQFGGDVAGLVAEHPVDFLAPRLGDGVDGRAHLALPGLAGEHPRHAGRADEQRPRLGVADHLLQVQRWVMVGGFIEDGFIQAGFGIALAQLAEQQLSDLGYQLRVGRDAPVRVRRQLLAVELPERWRQAVPQPWRDPGAARLERAQDLDQKGRVGFFRARQHQVGFEVFVGLRCALEAFGAVGGELDQGGESLLQAGHGRVAQQALVGLDVGGP